MLPIGTAKRPARGPDGFHTLVIGRASLVSMHDVMISLRSDGKAE